MTSVTYSPGSYDHGVQRQRHVTYEETFGGPRQVKGPVPVKCTMGEPDKVNNKFLFLIYIYQNSQTFVIAATFLERSGGIVSKCMGTVNNIYIS